MHEVSNGQATNIVDTKIYTSPKLPVKKMETTQTKDGARFMETDAMDTVDIIFENITYTVSLGYRKGQCSRDARTLPLPFLHLSLSDPRQPYCFFSRLTAELIITLKKKVARN